MPSIEEQIREIEEEIRSTPYNKASQRHIGRLKAKLAQLREEAEGRRSKRRKSPGYTVRKSGNATVAIVGFPSVGKSTLLNKVTNAESEVGDYAFTTLDVVPGIMEYCDAKIQVLDMPGLIKDASRGRGRGKEVLSVVRSADLILLMIDVFETNLQVLVDELDNAGVRLNTRPPDVQLSRRSKGGIEVNSTVRLTRMDEELVKEIIREFGIVNASVVIREDVDEDRLIDALAQNRRYVPAIVVINKIDLVNEAYLQEMRHRLKGWEVIPISAESGFNLDLLKERIYSTLDLVRIYMKPQGREADLDEPLVVRNGTDVAGVCMILHRDFKSKFRYAQVWGRSAKFPGQIVGPDHVFRDGDVVTIVLKR